MCFFYATLLEGSIAHGHSNIESLTFLSFLPLPLPPLSLFILIPVWIKYFLFNLFTCSDFSLLWQWQSPSTQVGMN